MREIKFRAWNKKTNEMLPHKANDGKVYAIEALNYPYIYDIMQYTGLKDKNGVDIYEGDVIKFKYTSSNYKKAYIEWNNEKASYDFIDEITKLNYSYNFRQLNNIEVIGNIYENPELLKGE